MTAVSKVIAKVNTRRQRVADNFSAIPVEVREQLDAHLTVAEAATLAHAAEHNTVQVGRYRLFQRSGTGKVGIYIANDGEGGEFVEHDLEQVIEAFYGEHF